MQLVRSIFNPREFTGWHMAGVLGLFFGTIFTVNMWLAYSAGTTWTGLVVKNTYVESQRFNTRTQELRQQAANGWKTALVYETGTLAVQADNTLNADAKVASVVVKIGRPVQEGEDQILHLVDVGNGRFSSALDLGPGLWEAHVQVNGQVGGEVGGQVGGEASELAAQSFRFTVKK